MLGTIFTAQNFSVALIPLPSQIHTAAMLVLLTV